MLVAVESEKEISKHTRVSVVRIEFLLGVAADCTCVYLTRVTRTFFTSSYPSSSCVVNRHYSRTRAGACMQEPEAAGHFSDGAPNQLMIFRA